MKKFNILSHKGNTCQYYTEIPFTPVRMQSSRKETTNSYEDVMKRNPPMPLVGT
jgi:hypothetical protein